ncbi:SDR family oxidoreductase [soil metagenome]
MNLENRFVVVTGGTSGIGKAIATSFAHLKATIIIIGSKEKSLQAVAQELRMLTTVHAITANLANSSDLKSLGTSISQITSTVDFLIHSAGVLHLGIFSKITPEMLDEQYAINVKAPFVLTQQLLPTLKKTKGSVVFINSSAAKHMSAQNATYAATKVALLALADGLRMEVNPNIRVLSVYPGRTNTPMQKDIFEKEGKKYVPELLLQPEDVAQTIVSALLLPESAEVTDISIRPRNIS